MCTVTWIERRDDGYEVFFNRDELRARPPGGPPELVWPGGVRALAPRDPQGGGTWIGVNEHGLCVALVNHYAARPAPGVAPRTSRGLLVASLLDADSADEIEARVRRESLERFEPFRLLAFEPAPSGASVRSLLWESELDVSVLGPSDLPVSTSSRDDAGAAAARRAALSRRTASGGGLDAERLLAFHESHEPERGALSPCMHREDASTVSFAHAVVTAHEVTLAVRPGSPCEGAPAVERRLARPAGAVSR